MSVNVVDFECVAPDHAATSQRPDKLTIHERRWAFCAFDALADGHAWKATGGIALPDLMRRAGLAVVLPPTREETKPARSASGR